MKRLIAVLLCFCFIFSGCGKSGNKNSTSADVDKVKDNDKYKLTANKINPMGIDIDSSFELTSSEKLSKGFVKDNLTLYPKTEFEVEKVSSSKYTIIPKGELNKNSVYQVKLKDDQFEYSWAFQTKKQLEIISTTPYDKSNEVPTNTGIEIEFNMDNLGDLSKHFSIEPNVEGSFETVGTRIVFVPKNELTVGQSYKVTIDKDFSLSDSEEKLGKDYKFSFTVASGNNSMYFDMLQNIYKDNPKYISGYIYNEYQDSDFQINVYKYKDFSKFETAVKACATDNNISESVINESDLNEVYTANQKPVEVEVDYQSKMIFDLPKNLETGYYVAKISNSDMETDKYVFLQINDMLMFDCIFSKGAFVYVADGKTNNGLEGAEVVINDKSYGKTGKDGVLSFSDEVKQTLDKTLCMTISKEGYHDFIYTNSSFNLEEYNKYNYHANRSYYFDTDRSVYLPTDTINFWGFLSLAKNNPADKVRVDLVESSTSLVIDSKEVELSKIGTYQGSFDIEALTSQYFDVKVYYKDENIENIYLSVLKYEKPIAQIESSTDKKVIYSGDAVNSNVNVSLMDGSPLGDYSITTESFLQNNYSRYQSQYDTQSSNVKTDKDGYYNHKVNTNVKSENWRPQTLGLYYYNQEAEDKQITYRDTITVFPKHKMLEIVTNDYKNPQNVTVMLHKCDISKYNDNEFDYDKLRGEALSGNVNVKVVEEYYESYVESETYDYINKVNVKKYGSRHISNQVYSKNLSINNGELNFTIPNYNAKRSYFVTASFNDSEGNMIEQTYIYGANYGDSNFNGYSLNVYSDEGKTDDYNTTYRLNDNINIDLMCNGSLAKDTDNDKVVILFLKNGLTNYLISDTTSIKTKYIEDYIAGTNVEAYYLKNGYIYSPYGQYINYDQSERKLTFDVKTDKERYKPGDEVTVSVNVKDESGKPVVADVNLSVVDEAYFKVFPKEVNTLSSLYASMTSYSDGIYQKYMSNTDIMAQSNQAEMGGGGEDDYGNIRDKFKDTAVFKTVTTDDEGNASMKFTLPDNLTTWRVTYQGITSDYYAGSGKINFTSGLPVFVDMILADEYLQGDSINATLRTLGTDTVRGQNADYQITIKNKSTGKENVIKSTAKAGEFCNVNLGNLDIGDYQITVGTTHNGQNDALQKDFKVVESSVYFNNLKYYDIEKDTKLDKVYSNAVITVANKSRSDFYNSLNDKLNMSGSRLDQNICPLIAANFINKNFDTKLEYDEKQLMSTISNYEDLNGGYKMFPYSGVEPLLSAELIRLVDNKYIDKKVEQYFSDILDNREEYDTDIAISLWGLSKSKKPVLINVYNLLDNKEINLELRDKIYLILALIDFGDEQTAYKNYKDIVKDELTKDGEYLYVDSTISEEDKYELTSLLSIAGVKLGDYKNSDKMFKYIYNVPSKYTLTDMEQLIYIMNRNIMNLSEIKDLFGEVTIEVDGKAEKHEVKLFDTYTFSVEKDKVEDIKFSKIKGDLECKVRALGNKDDLDKNKDTSLQLDISYLNEYEESSTEYNLSDLVKVVINPSAPQTEDYEVYQMTYVVPAGFRYMEMGECNYWCKEDGQKLVFYGFNNKYENMQPITFYIQAVQKGEYGVDYSVIRCLGTDKLNYTEKAKLIVK